MWSIKLYAFLEKMDSCFVAHVVNVTISLVLIHSILSAESDAELELVDSMDERQRVVWEYVQKERREIFWKGVWMSGLAMPMAFLMNLKCWAFLMFCVLHMVHYMAAPKTMFMSDHLQADQLITHSELNRQMHKNIVAAMCTSVIMSFIVMRIA